MPTIITGTLFIIFLCVTLWAVIDPTMCFPMDGIDHGSGEPFTVYVGDC